ncbi:hypothetical protein [Croceitalea vernalis]|uniref:Uncharacterized protein n=1 Tax=Croceitalea vernalis TaxID=3075599 RepID=A0ABU3BFF7_9FLAO|nr:hypothetical protein [Croceitalea sp. P007]MDT0620873.1 hypothetical protein [Croceitalea sp. P007]
MKPRFHIILSIIIFICILIFGFTHKISSGDKEMLLWSEGSLVWDDFTEVRNMDDDYVATIYSNIACPNLITENTSKVYAFMNPNISERLKDEYDSYNVLNHEQYHFNITEYCARLLRKDLVSRGLGGLSLKTIKDLKIKYIKKLDSLQKAYDSITDHNSNWKEQRQWELKIDDWLRQTSYYENEDIYEYYDFSKNRTRFFRSIYFTFTHKILTSYPIGEKDIKHGETYEILYNGHKEKIVKFFKDGKLINGGYFETAITKIIEKEKDVFEVHYLNSDESYNQNLKVSLRVSSLDAKNNLTTHYFNGNRERIEKNSIYETIWRYDSNTESYYSTYLDKKGRITLNKEGVYHQKRVLDEKERTILIENYDKRRRLKNDKEYIARRELVYNEENRKIYYRLYDEKENFAFHLGDYHLAYDYDERGNVIKVTSLNKDGKPTYDDNGASIYEYTYDLFDREILIKRFNKTHQPIIANDDYFKQVKEYDSLGRIQLLAYYYPDYVLKYSDDLWGATKYIYEGDSIIKEQNLDAYGDIVQNENNVAITKKRFNRRNKMISEIYLDVDGSFAKMDDGIVEYRYQYDEHGNTIETSTYDSIGSLKEFESDVAIIKWEYDENGNKSSTTYFNANNELAIATDRITYNIYEYRKDGKLLERRNYDINKKSTSLNGVFKTKFVLNNAGLDSIQFQYESNGKLKKGVAITRFYYNKYNNLTRTEYYDSSNRRIRNLEGVSAVNYIYNKRQYKVGNVYFNEYNRRTNNNDGVSFEFWALNELGHTVYLKYLDKKSKPAIGPNGYHKIEYEWASLGETTRTSYFGTDLKPIEDEYGTAIYEYELEPSGMYTQIKRYNKKGELSENTLGTAISKYTPYLDGLYYLDEELNALGEVVNDSISK